MGRQPVWHCVPAWVATAARNQAFTLSVASLQVAIVIVDGDDDGDGDDDDDDDDDNLQASFNLP